MNMQHGPKLKPPQWIMLQNNLLCLCKDSFILKKKNRPSHYWVFFPLLAPPQYFKGGKNVHSDCFILDKWQKLWNCPSGLILESWRVYKNCVGPLPFHNKPLWIFRSQRQTLKCLWSFSVLPNKGKAIWLNQCSLPAKSCIHCGGRGEQGTEGFVSL